MRRGARDPRRVGETYDLNFIRHDDSNETPATMPYCGASRSSITNAGPARDNAAHFKSRQLDCPYIFEKRGFFLS